jgi:hypothetical protein
VSVTTADDGSSSYESQNQQDRKSSARSAKADRMAKRLREQHALGKKLHLVKGDAMKLVAVRSLLRLSLAKDTRCHPHSLSARNSWILSFRTSDWKRIDIGWRRMSRS